MRKLLLLLLGVVFFAAQAMAQRTITGKVTDEKGQPVVKASVVVKGTTAGTTTNDEGLYSISVPANAKTLVFTAVDMGRVEVSLGAESIINPVLRAEERVMSEVVVTALGIEKTRKALGYSASTLKNDDLTTARTTNIANSLAGKVAGVRVSGSNGAIGSGTAIFIRGFNTIQGSNQPLFVVDGIPIDNGGGGNALQTGVSNSNRAIDLNQDDIESLTVLKGPAAAVLYGSRAASGAIIITTKKGRLRQKNNIQFTSSVSLSNVNRLPDYQTEYGQGGTMGVYQATSPFSWGPRIVGQTVTNHLGLQEQLQSYPSNVENFFNTGTNIQNNLTMTGGGNNISYRVSYGNLYEKGIISNERLVRNNFAFNGSAKPTEKLTVGVSANYVNSSSRRIQQGNQLANPMFRLWFLPRSHNLFNYPYKRADESNLYFDVIDNPLWTIEKNKYRDYISRFIGNVNLKFDVNKWFNITYKLGGDFYNQYEKGFDEIGSTGQGNTAAGGVGGILDRNSNVFSYYSYLNFNFKKTVKDFELGLVIGNENAWRGSRVSTIFGRQLSVRGFWNLSNASVFNPTNGEAKQYLSGLYGDFNVSYKGILSLNLTGRNDWSSTFGADRNSYFYPGVAGTFNFGDAIPGLKNSKVFSYGKVFANYAKVGKEAGAYANNPLVFGTAGAADGFGPTISFPFNGLPGFTVGNGPGDPGLSPEFTASYEVGAELGFLKDRVHIEVTRFIFNVPSAPASGVTSFLTNAGVLKTKGWEAMLRVSPIRKTNFNWDISFNYTKNLTMVEKLAEGVPNIVLAGFVTPNIRLEAGKPYGIIFGSVFRRNAAGQLWLNAAGQPVLAPNNDQIGNTNPDYLLGINNDFSWKGFNLSFLLDIRKGGDVFSRNLGDLRRSGVVAETAEFPRFNPDGSINTPYIIDGVGPDGVTKNTVKLNAQQYWGSLFAFGVGETYVFDGSWFRLREMSISYKMPSEALGKTFMGGLEFGVMGRNLFLKAKNFPHLDPENNVLGVSNAQGFEFNGLPSTRSIGLFTKINF
jgi:TonB-linked SusC/RagA family outer membrane protein